MSGALLVLTSFLASAVEALTIVLAVGGVAALFAGWLVLAVGGPAQVLLPLAAAVTLAVSLRGVS